MANPVGRPSDYVKLLKDRFLSLVINDKLKSKECADLYVKLKMNGAIISLDWPPKVEFK